MTGISSLKIKNETQVFYAKRLGEAYIEVINLKAIKNSSATEIVALLPARIRQQS